MIFRILVLALLIFWSVWVFQSCEYRGNDNNVNVEEVQNGTETGTEDTTKLPGEPSDKEVEVENTETMNGDVKDQDEKDAEVNEDEVMGEKEDEATEKTSLLGKMFGKKDKASDDKVWEETEKETATVTMTKPVVKVAPKIKVVAPLVKEDPTPDRDTYIRLYVYENRIDSFGKPAETGRVHFEVINMTRFSHEMTIPGCGVALGTLRPGETTYMGFEPKYAGEYVVTSNFVRGQSEVTIQVVD
ncbi:MAG TPA: hypothetical protein VIT68_02315 [Candidatus Gracilibacteria bacterium]